MWCGSDHRVGRGIASGRICRGDSLSGPVFGLALFLGFVFALIKIVKIKKSIRFICGMVPTPGYEMVV